MCYKTASREEMSPVGFHAAERPAVLPLTNEEHSPLDLNYLYKRHQVSLFMAEHSASDPVRQVHRELAERYADRIAEAKLPGTRPSAA